MKGHGVELTVPWRLAQTHSEPFRGAREEAPSLIQSPLLRPAHPCSPSVSQSRLRMAGSLCDPRRAGSPWSPPPPAPRPWVSDGDCHIITGEYPTGRGNWSGPPRVPQLKHQIEMEGLLTPSFFPGGCSPGRHGWVGGAFQKLEQPVRKDNLSGIGRLWLFIPSFTSYRS